MFSLDGLTPALSTGLTGVLEDSGYPSHGKVIRIVAPAAATLRHLAHQDRTIAVASEIRVDGAKLQEIPQGDGVLSSETTARNRKAPAKSGLTEPNRQKSRREKGFQAQKPQLEIANR